VLFRAFLWPFCIFFFAAFASGCGHVAAPAAISPPAFVAAEARYPVRADLMAVGDLGAPPKWYAAGYPPLRSARLGDRSPDPEFAALLRPKVGKAILDPEAGLTPGQRDDIARFLDGFFGTPSAPTVRVPTADDAKKLRLEEVFPKKGEQAEEIADATAAKEGLKLDDAALARGGVLYRRWCLQCHGPTGAGDGAHAIQLSAMPRDYRRGMFKFVTCFPPGTPRKGELGKARKDDLKRTIRQGLDGSMMPPFPQLSDADLDDLAGYVIHLSVRGEAEFETIARVIQLATNPRDDDPAYSPEFAEQQLAAKVLTTLANWNHAAHARIPVPPEHTPTQADRLASASRGYKAFAGTCGGCHQDYGRTPQLKFDAWGTVVQPRNLTLGVYRGGRRGEDLYARVYGGIYPSTMPDSKAKAAATPDPGKPDEIWDVVHFLQALADPRERMLLQQYDPGFKFE
jgi:mono/diheme cytochrome c family protein